MTDFFYPFAPEWLSIGGILCSQAKGCALDYTVVLGLDLERTTK